MTNSLFRAISLLFLAIVFTAGLTFATVELPELVDDALQHTITTPGEDSHADPVARLKTELFMAHYHVRDLGYAGFFLLVSLIAVGFATRRTRLATIGAFGVMLPVFAQFAGVMFFLAGLGILNAIWLPVLDVSYELQNWGLVINLPNDILRWLLGLVGVHSIWPTILLFIGGGILVFLLGTYAWLASRARGKNVADFWVYRISRHPQYLGWILWTYGAYLLLQRMHYPRRSWGIEASLPWLISTAVIIGVAMLEEITMRKHHGEVYESYRRSTPFLFPVPRMLAWVFAVPFRLLFRKDRPDRRREVAAAVSLYTVLLMAVSAFFYAGGLGGTLARLASPGARAARMERIVSQVSEEDNPRRQPQLLWQLVAFGDPAVEPLVGLLEAETQGLRVEAANFLKYVPSERALPALVAALEDPDENMRYRAAEALAAIASREAIQGLVPLLDDPSPPVRVTALECLAALGAEEIIMRAPEFMASSESWIRSGATRSLGTLGVERAIPVVSDRLEDESAAVRREAVIALLRIGSSQARPSLERAVADDDFEVRVYAREALKRLPEG